MDGEGRHHLAERALGEAQSGCQGGRSDGVDGRRAGAERCRGQRDARSGLHRHVRAQAASRRASLLRTTIVPQSEQTLEVSRVGYQTDQVDFLVLIDNQRTLLDTQVDYFRALNDLERARAALKRAVGTDIPARISVGPSDTGRVLR